MNSDLLVIGGGPGGYLAAERAAQSGLSVTLFEERNLGGVCLNEGCMPTKALLYSAKIAGLAAHGKRYGVAASGVELDHPAVIKRKARIVRTLVGGVQATLSGLGIRIVNARARILQAEKGRMTVEADGQQYTGKNLIIAAGSESARPPIYGLEEGLASGFVLTNREILELTEVPDHLVVIGGGVIGLEFASYFRSAGAQVTVIELLDHIAGPTDREISTILQRNCEKQGIDFLLESQVKEIGGHSVTYVRNNNYIDLFCDKILMSVGRRPASQDLGLEAIGIEMEGPGIKTDQQCRTNLEGVYAVGDINGKSLLAHTAYREAEVAVKTILGEPDAVNYQAIPAVIYTNPEVAGAGETEETAAAKGLDFRVQSLSMRYSGRYLAENEGGDGICKLLVENGSDKVLGVHLIGNMASEIIFGAAAMVDQALTLDDVKKWVFPHPTVGEIIRESFFVMSED